MKIYNTEKNLWNSNLYIFFTSKRIWISCTLFVDGCRIKNYLRPFILSHLRWSICIQKFCCIEFIIAASRVKKKSLEESLAGSHAYNLIRDPRWDSWRDFLARKVSDQIVCMTPSETLSETRFFYAGWLIRRR